MFCLRIVFLSGIFSVFTAVRFPLGGKNVFCDKLRLFEPREPQLRRAKARN